MTLLWLSLTVLVFIALLLLIAPIWRQHTKLITVLLLAVPIGSFSLYSHWGASDGLAAFYQAQERAVLVNKMMQTYESPQEVILTLQQHLKENPLEAQGWFLLARLYLGNNNLTDANIAAKEAVKIEPENPEYLMQLAEIYYISNERSLNETAHQLLDRILALEPNNPYALNLIASDAYLREDFAKAIEFWRKIHIQLPRDSQGEQSLANLIERAQEKLAKRKK